MRKILRLAALIVALGGVIAWLALGANRGWTKTSEMVTTVDEVTELPSVEHVPKFSPGVDFLGAALAAAFLLYVAGVLIKKKPRHENS